MQASIFWCLSQARINWDSCARKGIQHKMVRMAELGVPISQDGWQCIRIVDAYACVIFILLQKIRKMANKGDICISPRGHSTCLRKQQVGKPSWNAAEPCARAQGCVNDELRADGLWKGWGFWVST